MNLNQRYDRVLQERKQGSLYRELATTPNVGIDFTHNDYLGLSKHPEVISAATKAAESWGVGGQASRLLGAEANVARDLESFIAETKSEQGSALVFSSGYQLNQTVTATLLKSDFLGAAPQVFSDRLIHASLHAGIQSTGVRLHRFQHNDLDHLETLLKSKGDPDRPKFVFVESIYGMDGDVAPLERLYELKSRFGFYLYVDEAHAIGVAGPDGYGLAQQSENHSDIVVGTFSKAIGASGGFVVCSKTVREFLVNFCPGFIYSTAPSPVVLSAALASWRLSGTMTKEREQLDHLAELLRSHAKQKGYSTGTSTTHIVPILMESAETAKQVAGRMLQSGIAVACIRPPTVPTARIRVSLSARHTEEDVMRLVEEL